MRTTTTARLAAALAASALALAACGGDDTASDDPATSPDDAVSAPADPGTGTDGGAAGGTRPADQEFAPEERASMLFGTTEPEAENLALEFGWTIRTGRVDDEQYMLTEDYQLDRMTLEYDTPEDGGEPVVTSVTIELDGGPQTFTSPEAGSAG